MSKTSYSPPDCRSTRTGPSGPGRQTAPRRSNKQGTSAGPCGGRSRSPERLELVEVTRRRPHGAFSAFPPEGEAISPRGPLAPSPGGGGQLTVVRAGNGRPLRKVPTSGNTGSGGNPTGESPSSGAATTQPGGTVMVVHRRFHRDMVSRPLPRKRGLTGGMRCSPDRRGERAVECCLNQNGAYYHDLAGSSGNWRTAGPKTCVFGPGTPAPMGDRRSRRPSVPLSSVLRRV